MRIEIKLTSENFHHFRDALRIAEDFHKKFPLRIGMYHGVAYRIGCSCLNTTHELSLYVYRTPNLTIVVRQSYESRHLAG